MRISGRSLLPASVVLLSVGLLGQQLYQPKVLARLSYDNSAMSQREGVRHVCVMVSADGWYRFVRAMDHEHTLRAQGKLPVEEFQQLKKSLDSRAFRKLPRSDGGLILQDAEIFAAELPGNVEFEGMDHTLSDNTQRVRWLNADGENPFPAAIASVVDWLKRFEPKDGKAFEYAEFQDVCPTAGLSLVQPSVAGNRQQ